MLSDIYFKNYNVFLPKNIISATNNSISINFLNYFIIKKENDNNIVINKRKMFLDESNIIRLSQRATPLNLKYNSIDYKIFSEINIISHSKRTSYYFHQEFLDNSLKILISFIPKKLLKEFNEEISINKQKIWLNTKEFVKFLVTRIFIKRVNFLLLKNKIQNELWKSNFINRDILSTIYKINQGSHKKITIFDYVNVLEKINNILEFQKDYPNLIFITHECCDYVFEKDYLSSKRVHTLDDIKMMKQK